MKSLGPVTLFGCALWCGISTSAAAAQSPDGKVYRVHVFSSFGTQFDDCFTFNNSGILSVRGYGRMLYRHDELNTQPKDWQATARTNPPFGFVLTFHGSVGGSNGQTIVADAVSSEGDTFIVRGVRDAACASSAARRRSASPYQR